MNHREFPLRIVLAAFLAFTFVLESGCGGSAAAPKKTGGAESKPREPLRVLVVDDPALSQAIEKDWQARSETPVEMKNITAEKIASAKRLPADLIVFPAGLLGQLAQNNLISPLGDEIVNGEPFARQDILEQIRKYEMNWGTKAYAVPLGSPQFTLLYRADIFAKLKVQPPVSWAEYQALLVKLQDTTAFADLAPQAGDPWRATVEPLAPGWAGQLLLARSAAYAAHPQRLSVIFDLQTMQPLIDSPPFVRALEELCAANKLPSAKVTQENLTTLTPAGARKEILAGRCGMALSWPTASLDPNAGTAEKTRGIAIGYAEAPGSPDLFDAAEQKWTVRKAGQEQRVSLGLISGRMAAVTTSANAPKEAENMLVWLASAESSERTATRSESATLFRVTQAANPQVWLPEGASASAAAQYAQAVRDAQFRSIYVQSPRIPGRDQYLAALDEAVQAAVQGKSSPRDALTAAAEKWSAITKSHGPQNQRQALERSLGIGAGR